MRRFSSLFLATALCAPMSAQASLSCATPCTAGTLSQSGNYYDIFVDCSTGAYSAATGSSHPATIASGLTQNVIYGGSGGTTGTSSLGLFLYSTNEHFSSDAETGAVTVTATGSCLFDPPDLPTERASLGVETEYLITDSQGNQYTWRHEVVTFGDTDTNAGTRLTQSVTTPAAPASTDVGMRWQVDYQSGFDDGPTFATVVCDPFSTSSATATEQDLGPADLDDFYQIVNNDGFSTIVENFTSTTSLGGFPNAGTPDRVVYAPWGTLVDAPWAYVSGSANADSDSAILYYYGATQPNALSVPASSTQARSVVLFNGVDGVDCGDFIPKDTGDPKDTDPPVDSDPVDTDTDEPDTAVTFHYAGGCAACSSSGGPAPVGLLALALAVPLIRRRRDGGRA